MDLTVKQLLASLIKGTNVKAKTVSALFAFVNERPRLVHQERAKLFSTLFQLRDDAAILAAIDSCSSPTALPDKFVVQDLAVFIYDLMVATKAKGEPEFSYGYAVQRKEKTFTLADLFSDVPESLKINLDKDPSAPAPTPTTAIHIPVASSEPKYEWTDQQNKALNMIYAWLRDPKRKPIFRLFGYAGTGKTTLAKEVAAFVQNESGKQGVPRGPVLFAAFSGKAADVMRKNGCVDATTLHSKIYRPDIDPNTGRIRGYVLNHESPVATASLLIVDEVSMVNEALGLDVMSFRCPVLVLGDPFQLPPVEGYGYFTMQDPDFMLTDIRRQAKDNPITYLATRVREGKRIKPGKYGDSTVHGLGYHVSDDYFSSFEQVLVGTNSTRKSLNVRSRKISGRYHKDPIFPVKGDRLVCLRNRPQSLLLNGTLWTCSQPEVGQVMVRPYRDAPHVVPGTSKVLKFKIRSVDNRDSDGKLLVYETQVPIHLFNPNIPEPPYRELRACDEFDYGDVLTVHKAQGSQYESGLIYDESSVFGEDADRHRYTAITRFISRMSIIL